MNNHSEKITLENLLGARRLAAKVVVTQGEKFLPIFKRLDKELRNFRNAERQKGRGSYLWQGCVELLMNDKHQ